MLINCVGEVASLATSLASCGGAALSAVLALLARCTIRKPTVCGPAPRPPPASTRIGTPRALATHRTSTLDVHRSNHNARSPLARPSRRAPPPRRRANLPRLRSGSTRRSLRRRRASASSSTTASPRSRTAWRGSRSCCVRLARSGRLLAARPRFGSSRGGVVDDDVFSRQWGITHITHVHARY